MRRLRTVSFVLLCVTFCLMSARSAKADFFQIPGQGCDCGDETSCMLQCYTDCNYVCDQITGIDCYTATFDCGFNECNCGYSPAN
jgi:hypothetical protein